MSIQQVHFLNYMLTMQDWFCYCNFFVQHYIHNLCYPIFHNCNKIYKLLWWSTWKQMSDIGVQVLFCLIQYPLLRSSSGPQWGLLDFMCQARGPLSRHVHLNIKSMYWWHHVRPKGLMGPTWRQMFLEKSLLNYMGKLQVTIFGAKTIKQSNLV